MSGHLVGVPFFVTRSLMTFSFLGTRVPSAVMRFLGCGVVDNGGEADGLAAKKGQPDLC